MIDTTKLFNVRTIVTHDGCPDGVASAMILKVAMPDAKVVFARYGSAELAALPATEGMLFCDFSPPADRVQEFVDVGAIVLDHHKTARAVVEAFGENGVFGDEATEPGVCGAVLAYRVAIVGAGVRDDAIEDFATLAGIRDTWQRQDPRWIEACAQAEALRFWPREYLVGLTPFRWAERMAIGGTLLQKKAEQVEEKIREAYRCEIAGQRVVMFDGSVETSDAMEALKAGTDLVVGFRYLCDGGRQRLNLSCRSRGLDVSAFAKRHGGGGHTQAAGCTLDVLPGDANPYERVRELIGLWLGARS